MDSSASSFLFESSKRIRNSALISFTILLLGGLVCFWIYPEFPTGSFGLSLSSNGNEHRNQTIQSISRSSNFSIEELWNLDQVLQNATNANSTVILTPLNQAWADPGSMLDIMLESFHLGENTSQFLSNLVMVALDSVAFKRCLDLHPHCFQLHTEGVDFSGESNFMTDDYLKMTRRKISFLAAILQLGYSFVFTDGDILWFRNPFPHLSDDVDFEVSCDRFLGDETNIDNFPNTGFLHVKASKRTVELFNLWHRSCESYSGSHDQDVFNMIKHTKEFQETGAKIRFLPTKYFSSFCERPSGLESFCTMHSNCCRGLKAKLEDLRLVLDDWKHFQAQTSEESSQKVLFRAPDACKRSW